MREMFGHFAKVLEGNALLVPEIIQNAKSHQIAERIEPAERLSSIRLTITRAQKADTIPPAQLRAGDPAELCGMILAEGANNIIRIFHSASFLSRSAIERAQG